MKAQDEQSAFDNPQPHAAAAPTSANHSVDAAGSCDDIQAVLDAHNKERKQWGAAPLKWSESQVFPASLQLPL